MCLSESLEKNTCTQTVVPSIPCHCNKYHVQQSTDSLPKTVESEHALALRNFFIEVLPDNIAEKMIDYFGDNLWTNNSMVISKHVDGIKHLEKQWFFMRELFQQGILSKPKWISTKDNESDLGTKSVDTEQFKRLLPKLMVRLSELIK